MPAPTFTATGLPAGLTLDPAGKLTGNPTTAGTNHATVTATNGVAPDATQAFDLTVNPARAPLVTLSTSSIDFGTSSNTLRTFDLTNTGTAPLTGTIAVGPTPPFSTVAATTSTPGNKCGPTTTISVTPRTKCTIVLQFRTAVSGDYTGAVTLTDNAANSPQTVRQHGRRP